MEKWTRLLIVLSTVLLMMVIAAAVIRLSMYIQHTLLLFSLGALVAYAFDPLVELIRRAQIGPRSRSLSREVSVLSVFLMLFIVFGLASWLLGGSLVRQFTWVSHNYPKIRDRAERRAGDFDDYLRDRNINFSLTQDIQHPPKELAAEAGRLGQEAFSVIGDTVKTVGESVFVLLFALYFLLYGADMRQKFNGLLPDELRERANLWETDVNRILGGFVRGQAVIALIMGAVGAIGCLSIGIRPWLLIGVFVVFASLIPVLGPYIGALPAIIAALIGPDHFFGAHIGPVAAAILIAVWFVIINEIGSKILYPKLVGSALGLHVVLVLFVIFAGLEIDGVIGVLFAAPVTALVIVTVVHLYRYWQGLPDNLLSKVARVEGEAAKRHEVP